MEPEYYYGLYKEIITRRESMNLNPQFLIPYISTLLSKPFVVEYLCKKCDGFRNTYKEHKVNKHKLFVKMSQGSSFATSILFYLYH